jgi:hypothetical protein
MPNRTITTRANGNVTVIDHSDGKSAFGMREYTQCGPYIYLIREGMPPQPMCRGLSTHGQPLRIGSEQLVDVITQALAEFDRANGPTWAQRIGQAFGRRFQQLIGVVR